MGNYGGRITRYLLQMTESYMKNINSRDTLCLSFLHLDMHLFMKILLISIGECLLSPSFRTYCLQSPYVCRDDDNCKMYITEQHPDSIPYVKDHRSGVPITLCVTRIDQLNTKHISEYLRIRSLAATVLGWKGALEELSWKHITLPLTVCLFCLA